MAGAGLRQPGDVVILVCSSNRWTAASRRLMGKAPAARSGSWRCAAKPRRWWTCLSFSAPERPSIRLARRAWPPSQRPWRPTAARSGTPSRRSSRRCIPWRRTSALRSTRSLCRALQPRESHRGTGGRLLAGQRRGGPHAAADLRYALAALELARLRGGQGSHHCVQRANQTELYLNAIRHQRA